MIVESFEPTVEHPVVRRVVGSDVEQIVVLMNSIIRAGAHSIMDTEITIDEQRAFIGSLGERGIYHAAVARDGMLLGLQDVLPHSDSDTFRHVGEVSTFVADNARRQGVGRALMNATVDAARTVGYRKICANIRADNDQALAFYSSQGFRVIGIANAHAFVRGQYIDEVLTERLL